MLATSEDNIRDDCAPAGVLQCGQAARDGGESGTMAIQLDLTQVSPFNVRLDQFEGPLDLLLHLIKQQQLDIYDIPIARVTDQYLAFMRTGKHLDLAMAGEYIIMAATLIEIKSAYLLPKPALPEEEPGPDPRQELVRRLLEYEKFKEVAELLRTNEDERQFLLPRTAGVDPDDLPAVASDDVSPMDLLKGLKRVLDRIGQGIVKVTTLPRQRITLRMKMAEMVRRVREHGPRMPFVQFFVHHQDRTSVVVAFLALLELVRIGKLKARQPKTMGEIYISEREEKTSN